MKKLLLASFILFGVVSDYPCHPNGDIGPCVHRLHINDTGACGHFDYYGNRIHSFDYYPCTHNVHMSDVYPCTHYCF